LMVDDTVRCPWHHACFSLRTGEALHAPALSSLACWSTEVREGKVFVRAKTTPKPAIRIAKASDRPQKIVIVGGGAAGFAAAEMLRRQDYQGEIVMVSDDGAPPVDRPNLSKDYLAGNAPEEWVPLRDEAFYRDQHIDLRVRTTVAGIDIGAREVVLGNGGRIAYDRLLLATGAEPVRLPLPGMDLPHVHTLRTLADCRAIIARVASAKRAVVMGASFIGLEVAASLRARDLDVHVVAPGSTPLAKVLGPELGAMIQVQHEAHGVLFHLGQTAAKIEEEVVVLQNGERLPADMVVVGIGVRPRLDLAQAAGLTLDRGVVVNEYLETSAPGIYAAGDIARWPDAHIGEQIRVEHWVVAQRQGQTAARNMLGAHERFDAVPFFWSQHYALSVRYTGHAEQWDSIDVDGRIAERACSVAFRRNGKTLAVASVKRDRENLEAEVALEANDEAALQRLVAAH